MSRRDQRKFRPCCPRADTLIERYVVCNECVHNLTCVTVAIRRRCIKIFAFALTDNRVRTGKLRVYFINMKEALDYSLITRSPTFIPKLPLSFDDLHPSNTPTTQNGIQIQSAVLSQYTLRADRQTDRHMTLAPGLYQEPLTLNSERRD